MAEKTDTLISRAISKLESLERELVAIDASLEDPEVTADHRRVRAASVQRAAIAPVVILFRAHVAATRELEHLEADSARDPELAALAREEIPILRAKAAAALEEATSKLVNADDGRIGSVILELRAGTGGDEAGLWARDLLDMYERRAAKRGWSLETLDISQESDTGGIRTAVVNIRGEGVWSELAFEAGVHSVKRVPATETQGRIHTSTATVAVLPEPEEVDVKIDWSKDVEEHVTTSQGPGGQNVNKVATAVQLHHKPSGILIRMQESKSQQQNRERARRLLVAKLYEIERQRSKDERSAARKGQIGDGSRSEKIRTYRFKEGIVADERLPGEYALRDLLAGDMNELVAALRLQQTATRLAEL